MNGFPQLDGFHGAPGLVRLIGHRGARGVMPENTIQGFEFTLDIGVSALEFDVMLTRDAVPVITHNHHLSKAATREANGKWLVGEEPKVSDFTLAQLKYFDVGGLDGRTAYGKCFPDQAFLSDIRIPRLSELLELATVPKGKSLYFLLEIKSDRSSRMTDIVEKVVGEVRQRDLSNRTVLHSFDWDILEECRRIAPEMPRSYLSQTPENANDPLENSPDAVTPDFSSFEKSIPQAVADQGGQMWCPYFKDVTSDLVNEAHELGLLVSTWTVNEIEDMERVIDAGVDSIVTDYPGRAQRLLSSRNLRWY